MRNESYIAERFLDKVREAYLLEKGERLAELEGRRLPFKDGAGLHPVSLVTGQYRELFLELLACWTEGVPLNDAIQTLQVFPLEVRAAAREDASKEFVAAIFEEHYREEREEQARAMDADPEPGVDNELLPF